MSAELGNNFDILFSKMENILTTKTVVGEPLYVGDTIILPLVDVSFAIGAGTFDNKDEAEAKNKKATGGGALGAKITPSAVIVVKNGDVQLVSVKNQDSINKIIDMVPGILSRFNLGNKSKVTKDEASEACEAKQPIQPDELNTI